MLHHWLCGPLATFPDPSLEALPVISLNPALGPGQQQLGALCIAVVVRILREVAGDSEEFGLAVSSLPIAAWFRVVLHVGAALQIQGGRGGIEGCI